MSTLFLSLSNTHSRQQQQQHSNGNDGETLDVSETIERECLSVLHKLHDQVNGLQLVQVVVQPLASNYSSPVTAQALIARLDCDRDVSWLMEIIGYGLSMPFSPTGEQDSVKDCCTIYCEWLCSSLLPFNESNEDSKYQQLSKLVPVPIRKDPNRYARKMLSHLYNVFLPRQPLPVPANQSQKGLSSVQRNQVDAAHTAVSRQAVLCHRVLRTIENIAQNPMNLMDNETWEHLLALLLTVNDKLLSPPTEPDHIGTQLDDRVLGVLFDLMLLASNRSVPSAGLWRVFNEMCLNWRHRSALIDHWRRITLMLTRRINAMSASSINQSFHQGLLKHLGHDSTIDGSIETTTSASTSAIEAATAAMSYENLSHTWYHFLNIIGNPVDLANPDVISRTNEFYQSAISSDNVLDPRQHPSLNALPQIFMNSMMSLREFIETFITNQQQNFGACNDPDRGFSLDEPARPDRLTNQRGSIISIGSTATGAISTIPSSPTTTTATSGLGSTLGLLSMVAGSNVSTGHNSQQVSGSVTPTQSRRTGLKAMAMKSIKGVGSTAGQDHVAPASNVATNQQDSSKSSSISTSGPGRGQSGAALNSVQANHLSQQSQFSQPRASLTSISSRSSSHQQQIQAGQKTALPQFRLNPDRPKCNSILHVFGEWLFSAALIGSDLASKNPDHQIEPSGPYEHQQPSAEAGPSSFGSSSTATEVSYSGAATGTGLSPGLSDRRHSSAHLQRSIASSLTNRSSASRQTEVAPISFDANLSSDSFESGQAEAMAILCEIFSSKMACEEIAPNYLSRFYLCIQHCLSAGTSSSYDPQDPGSLNSNKQHQTQVIKHQLLASVLMNSTSLLQKDLDGINLLIPAFIKAIEFVFECIDKDIPVQAPARRHSRSGSIRQSTTGSSNQPSVHSPSSVTAFEIRRACIMNLLNLLAYPLHYHDLVIRNCLNDTSPTTTFGSLRPTILKLLFVALQTETDPTNMQILFGGLSSTIHDMAASGWSIPNVSNSSSSHDNPSVQNKHLSSSVTTDGGSHNESDSLNNDYASQNSIVFNSSGGLIVKSLHVTCHLLINIWKHDTQVSLAALELLTTISRVSTQPQLTPDSSASSRSDSSVGDRRRSSENTSNNNNNNCIYNATEMINEYKQTTRWICDYICNQCGRPPPAHSRDMHSTIVAAYQCLSAWIYNHPYLLSDESCVTTLMEVIELGVSGQKSRTSLGELIRKRDKTMRPSSMRVKEAAESLLNICTIGTRTSPLATGLDQSLAGSFDSTLDELSLVEMFSGAPITSNQRSDWESRQLEAYRRFRYFTDENQVIVGLLDGHHQDQSSRDSVICLLRTPFGKHCWRLKFNYYTERSREKIIANKTQGLIAKQRPYAMSINQHHLNQDVVASRHLFSSFRSNSGAPQGGPGGQAGPLASSNVRNKSIYFNPTAKFFPDTLPDSIVNTGASNLDHPVTSLDQYLLSGGRLGTELEAMSKAFSQQISAEQKLASECSIQLKRQDCEEPQTVSELEASRILVTHLGPKGSLTPLIRSDRISIQFMRDLVSVDQIPVRSCDTANVFYVRRGRTSAREILESVRERHQVSLAFFQWCLEVGQPTMVKNHLRWNGKSIGPSEPNSSAPLQNTTSLEEQQVLRNQMLASDHGGAIFDAERMTLYWSDMCQELAFLVPHKIERADGGSCWPSVVQNIGSNITVAICWLESADDLDQVPGDQLLEVAELGCLLEDVAVGSQGSSASPSSCSSTPATGSGSLNSASQRLRNRDHVRYSISPMRNGLYRLNVTTSFGKRWLALPLVDGMTVSRGSLANLMRESILNLCRRRRLDADSYQPPHVKRRHRTHEFCQTHRIA